MIKSAGFAIRGDFRVGIPDWGDIYTFGEGVEVEGPKHREAIREAVHSLVEAITGEHAYFVWFDDECEDCQQPPEECKCEAPK